jgi:hypothetical protein
LYAGLLRVATVSQTAARLELAGFECRYALIVCREGERAWDSSFVARASARERPDQADLEWCTFRLQIPAQYRISRIICACEVARKHHVALGTFEVESCTGICSPGSRRPLTPLLAGGLVDCVPGSCLSRPAASLA